MGGILTDLEKMSSLKGGYLKRKKYFRPFEGGVFLGRGVSLALPPDIENQGKWKAEKVRSSSLSGGHNFFSFWSTKVIRV